MRVRLFVAVVMAVSLTAAGCSSDSDDAAEVSDTSATSNSVATVTSESTASSTSTIASTTTVPLVETTTTATTTATRLSDDAAIAAVVSAIDAHNRFDLDEWLAAFDGGERRGVPLFAEQILMNAKQHWEIVGPCQATGTSDVDDTVVECLIVNTDDFWSVGEIYEPRTLVFHVNTDGRITTREGVTDSNTFRSNRVDAFNRAFHEWLSDVYPEVYYGGAIPSSSGPGFDTQNPDHMLIAVEYVEEFVAQSEKYPLDPTDQ